jgi:hypothetical protein
MEWEHYEDEGPEAERRRLELQLRSAAASALDTLYAEIAETLGVELPRPGPDEEP